MAERLDMVTLHFRRSDGAVTQMRTTHPENVSPPEGSVPITEEEYAEHLAELQAANAEHVAELRELDRQRTLTDYRALTALGLPHDSALRMSGYDVDMFGPIEDGGS